MDYKEMLKNYRVKKAQHKDRIAELEGDIEDMENEILALRDSPIDWVEDLLKPLWAEIKKRAGDGFEFPPVENEKFLRTGLNNRVMMSYWYNHKPNGIVFIPGRSGSVRYETGEKKKDSYKEGTVGAINKMDMVTREIDTIEDLLTFMKEF